jgi:hypothetical protein
MGSMGCSSSSESGYVADASTDSPDGGSGVEGGSSADASPKGVGAVTRDSGGGADATAEGGGASVECGTTHCTGSDVCCAIPANGGGIDGQCMASCPGGVPPVSCDGPEDCAGGTVCCGTVTTNAGMFPDCPVATAYASCVQTCAYQVPLACRSTTTARKCRVSADCASDSDRPKCCTFHQANQTLTFCTDDFTAGAGNGTCN